MIIYLVVVIDRTELLLIMWVNILDMLLLMEKHIKLKEWIK